jgi:FimV-like protein
LLTQAGLVVFIRIFVVALTVATFWWSSSSFGLGLGLGELNIHSSLASPLKASVTLRGMDGIDLDPEFFSIQIDSDSTSKIEYRLQRMDADTAVIDLYTREIVSNPLFQFRIEVKWDNSTVSRNYDVLVDPPVYQEFVRADEDSETGEAIISDAGQAGEQNDLSVQQPIVLGNVESDIVESSSVDSAEISIAEWPAGESMKIAVGGYTVEPRREYGPTINGNSIWRVARAVATDNDELTIYQWMYAIWSGNPQAFTRDNMHRLNMDEVLSIPLENEVAATAHLMAWRAYSNQMSLLPVSVPATDNMAQDAPVETEQQNDSHQEVADEAVVGQKISTEVAQVDDSGPVAEQEFEVLADDSLVAVLEKSASVIDEEFVVARSNDPVAATRQETVLIVPDTEVEAQQSVGVDDPIDTPMVEVSQVDESATPGDIANESRVALDALDVETADNRLSTNAVQQEVTAETTSMPVSTPDPELEGWSAALLSRHEFIDQLPVIGTGGALAFVGRAVQSADRYVATRPSWATLALGAWVTLVLMMLRQQWLARRTAAGATNLATADLMSKVVANSSKRRKSAARKAVQVAPKSTSEARQESADRTLSESVPQDREATSNAPEILAQANLILSQGDIEEAIKLMRLAVELQPNQPSLVILLLELYHKTQRAVFFAELLDRSRTVLESLETSDQTRLRSMHAQLCPDLPFAFQLDETTDSDEPLVGDSSHIDDGPDDEAYLETQIIFTNNGIPLLDEARSTPSMVGENFDLDVTLKEADVYLAYGLYDSAEELLLKGMEVDPNRADFLARLLDSYFATRNIIDFVACAEVMQDMGDAGSEYWEKVEVMGFELAPFNLLFAGGKDGKLKVAELEIARPQTADFEFSDIADNDNAAFTDIEIEESSEVAIADIEIYENEGDDSDITDLNLNLGADELVDSVDDDIDDLDSDLDSDLEQLLESEVSDLDDSEDEPAIVLETTDDDLDTILSESLIAAEDELETVCALEVDNDDVADDDDEINLDSEEEEVMQFTMDDDVEPGQDTMADGDDASLVLVEETTLDSLTSVNLDSSNSRILYFPESSSEGKDTEEFESEVKLTLQAVRDQLQNMTERLFNQERATNDLKQTLAELRDNNSSTRGKKSKKSS